MSTDTAETILAQLAELRALVAKQVVPRPVLTVAEACELANCGSASAFQRWCATWRVTPCSHGRYARRAILAGLDREASSVIRRRRTPARTSPPSTT